MILMFFSLLSLQQISCFGEAKVSDRRRIVYHGGRTMAVADVDANNNIMSCRLEYKKDDKELQDVIASTNRMEKRVDIIKKVSLDDMVKVISDCAYVDHRTDHPAAKILEKESGLMLFLRKQLIGYQGHEEDQFLWKGTQWCGYENIAESYFDIGEDGDLDRCCRAHDYCPFYQQSFSFANLSPITKSLCSCDTAFFDCLRALNTTISNKVGNIFFNTGAWKCIDLKQQFKCHDDACSVWEEDERAEPEVVVTTINKEYPYYPENFKTSLDLDLDLIDELGL